ncbi:MAG: TRAP transporter substrate-binding protein [Lachnospiraceae bacterium]|nr:TRAP transporter substrate-binding protein [Lachnospiraceae bacterium]
MKKYRITAIVMALLLAASMTACGSSSDTGTTAAAETTAADSDTSAADEESEAAGETAGDTTEVGDLGGQEAVTLKLASVIAVGAPGDLAANDFVEMVEEKTGGLVTIDYYPAGQLGSSDEISEQLLEGTIDLSWQTLDWYMTLQSDWNVLGLGFSVSSEEQLQAFLESDKEAEIEASLIEEDGVRLLAVDGIGSPRVVVSTMPVNSAEDLENVNMRVPSLTLYTKTWQAIGVNCITLESGDVYMGFKDGMIDATEFPLGSIYSNSYHEVASYITYTNHLYSIYCMGMNETTFQQLTEETQQILLECAEAACDAYMEYDDVAVEEGVAAMVEAGVTINENPDLESFQEKMADVAAECEAEGLWSEGLYDYLQSLG